MSMNVPTGNIIKMIFWLLLFKQYTQNVNININFFWHYFKILAKLFSSRSIEIKLIKLQSEHKIIYIGINVYEKY
jgi:hypothetical protein